jgi:ribonuclease E
MTPLQTVTLVIAIVVVIAVIIIIVLLVGRRQRVDANRRRATDIRQDAGDTALASKEQEARAVRAQADAKQAEVDAERLRREAAERQNEAQAQRVQADEQLRKADAVDPDVRTDRGGDAKHRDGEPTA